MASRRAKRVPVGKLAPGIWKRETTRGDRYDFKHPDGAIKGGYASLKEARAAKKHIEAQASIGAWRPPSILTLEQYATHWLDRRRPGIEQAAGERFERHRLEHSTHRSYESNLKMHVFPRLGNRSISSLRTEDVDDLIEGLERAGKAPGTIRNVIVPLRKLLNDAMRQGHISSNPAAHANLPPAQEFIGKEIPRQHTEAIRAALVELANERAPEGAQPDLLHVHLFDVALGTGLRFGELRALRWTDYDKEGRLLRIERAYSRRRLKRPKSQAGRRSVPVFPTVERALGALAARAMEDERYAPDELIFATRDNTPLHESNFNRREWAKALHKAGLGDWSQDEDGRKRWHGMYRLHDLRHTCASRLVAAGEGNVKLIQAIVGHSNAAILLNRYSHLNDAQVTEAASRFDPGAITEEEHEPAR